MSDTIIGAEQETNHAILIKVRNAAELARSQGAIASVAQALAPATIEAKVLSTMRDKLASSLRDQHVDAEVTIVEPKAFTAADGSKHIWTDVAVGVGAAGILMLLWRVLGHRGR